MQSSFSAAAGGGGLTRAPFGDRRGHARHRGSERALRRRRDHAGNRPPGDAGFARSPRGWTPNPFPAGLPLTSRLPPHRDPLGDTRTSRARVIAARRVRGPGSRLAHPRPFPDAIIGAPDVRNRQEDRNAPRKTPAVCTSKQQSFAVSLAS